VVDVTLGEDDVSERGVGDRRVVGLVLRRLEEHARVDDDVALVGRDEEAVRQPLGEMDEVVDPLRAFAGGDHLAGS